MKRKKQVVLAFACFLLFFYHGWTGEATEGLRDNQLDLKTDRIEQENRGSERGAKGVDPSLFNEEITEKLKEAADKKRQEQEEQLNQLFKGKAVKVQEQDTTSLFVQEESSGSTNTVESASNNQNNLSFNKMHLLPLFFTCASLGTGIFVSYRLWKKR